MASSNAEIEALRASMRGAQVFGKGQYILRGIHLLTVQKLFYKKSMIEGTAKESIICEFTVKESNNAEMVAGETRSAVFNFEKKGWLSRFKALVLALVGVDPEGLKNPAAEDAAADVLVALKHDDFRVQKGLPENFMSGRVVRAEGIPGTIKTGPNAGKPLVDVKWTPVAA